MMEATDEDFCTTTLTTFDDHIHLHNFLDYNSVGTIHCKRFILPFSFLGLFSATSSRI